MIRMVVFDMAGTTVNENNVVYKTLQKAINDHGFDFTLEQVLTEGAGKEKLQAIVSVLALKNAEDPKLSNEIYQHFIILLEEAYQFLDIQPQPHALELFEALREKRITIVLNTGYNYHTALALIEKLGWELGLDYDGLVTASDVSKNRPDPDMILLAMKKFGIENPKQVIKVGDSAIDIQEGQNAGCLLNIAVTTGAHSFQQLQSANPDFIINDLMELMPIIENSGAD
jgi:phosphonatase-like hydrolase